MLSKFPFLAVLRPALLALALVLTFGGRALQAVDIDAPPGGNVPIATPVDGRAPTIFLTFDDGPYQPWTEQMVDLLADYNAQATFFVIGRQAINDPELLKKVYDGGNALGNHGYNHANLTGVSQQFFNAEVGDTSAILGDMDSGCLRPPYGAIDYNVVDFADQLGISIVKWNLDPEDWRSPGADEIAQHVIDNARDGSIVVLHDGGGDRSQTVEAVRTILKTMTARGWQFKALCRDFPMDDITNALLETPTPDPAAAPTITPTLTPAPTETPWPTVTPTGAAAATQTATPSATASATASATPSTTPSVTPSSTPTATTSVTLSATPTATPSVTPSATPTTGTTAPSTPTSTVPPTLTPPATPRATATTAAPLPRATAAQSATPDDTAASAPAATPEPVYGAITFPSSGATVSRAILVQGYANHPSFEKWQVDLLVDDSEPIFLAMGEEPLINIGRLTVWKSMDFPNGPHMLRLRVVFADGNYVEYFTHVTVKN